MRKLSLGSELDLRLLNSQVTNDNKAESSDIARAFKITFGGAVQESAEITGFTFNSTKDSDVASATTESEVKILSAGSANLGFDTITVDYDMMESNLHQLIVV